MKRLQDVGVTATHVCGNKHYDEAVAGKYQFGMLVNTSTDILHIIILSCSVFISPESAVAQPWRGLFQSKTLSVVAIDEAHCIPEW